MNIGYQFSELLSDSFAESYYISEAPISSAKISRN
jgi:hypothetical protein